MMFIGFARGFKPIFRSAEYVSVYNSGDEIDGRERRVV